MPSSFFGDHRSFFRILSILLAYPEEDLLGFIPRIEAEVHCFGKATARSACEGFLEYLGSRPLMSLQEEYTRTFDLHPPTSLNLTYHQLGDSRERGQALIQLVQVYKSDGYEVPAGELPDYLPMILEFLSVCSPETGEQVLVSFQDSIRKVTDALRETHSPYARLFEALAALACGSAGSGG